MDSTVFIAILLVGLAVFVFVPITIAHRRDQRRKREKHNLIALEIARKNDLLLTQQEIINDQLLAIDPSRKMLVYSDLKQYPEDLRIIHLSEIDTGTLVRNTERIDHAGRNRTSPQSHVSDIGIAFYSAKKELLAECIFYDDLKNSVGQIPELTEKARNWLRKVSLLSPLKISERII